jgi:hypothetical protein
MTQKSKFKNFRSLKMYCRKLKSNENKTVIANSNKETKTLKYFGRFETFMHKLQVKIRISSSAPK